MAVALDYVQRLKSYPQIDCERSVSGEDRRKYKKPSLCTGTRESEKEDKEES